MVLGFGSLPRKAPLSCLRLRKQHDDHLQKEGKNISKFPLWL